MYVHADTAVRGTKIKIGCCGKCRVSVDRNDWRCETARSTIDAYRYDFIGRWLVGDNLQIAFLERNDMRMRIVLFHLGSTPLWRCWIFNRDRGDRKRRNEGENLLPCFPKGTGISSPSCCASHKFVRTSQTVRIDWNFAASVARQFSRMGIDGGTSPWSRIWRNVPFVEESITESLDRAIAA